MINPCAYLTSRFALPSRFWILPLALLTVGSIASSAQAQLRFYNPIPLTPGKAVADKLSTQDVPTGQGGFARDYVVQLQAGSQLAIDLTSDNFDSMVTLLAADGSTVAENDDGPDRQHQFSAVYPHHQVGHLLHPSPRLRRGGWWQLQAQGDAIESRPRERIGFTAPLRQPVFRT